MAVANDGRIAQGEMYTPRYRDLADNAEQGREQGRDRAEQHINPGNRKAEHIGDDE